MNESSSIVSSIVSTKDELIMNVKEWIKIDNELLVLKAEAKEKTRRKKELTELLVNTMKTNSIGCLDINGGSLIHKQNKTKKSISGKFLLSQLEEYYKDEPNIAKELTTKILNNRVEVVKDNIKRMIT